MTRPCFPCQFVTLAVVPNIAEAPDMDFLFRLTMYQTIGKTICSITSKRMTPVNMAIMMVSIGNNQSEGPMILKRP